jgi:hypothetical protein
MEQSFFIHGLLTMEQTNAQAWLVRSAVHGVSLNAIRFAPPCFVNPRV